MIGMVAYQLALPPSLNGVHDVFYVSLLKKCLYDMDTVIDSHQLEIQPNLTCVEKPNEDLGQKREGFED